MRQGYGAGCSKTCLFYFYPLRLMPSLLSWGNHFSPQAPELKISWSFGCPFSYPLPRESPSSSYLASAYSAALAQAFTLSIQPNADSSFLTSYVLPRHFSVLVISSVLSLSTSLPSPVAPWGPPTLSSCLYHGDGCYWAEYWLKPWSLKDLPPVSST